MLGPTNTGKTHLAVERMTGHASGLMGFPLRLLAREIYDRIVALKGREAVALITGEERIEPGQARYYCATAEAMPVPSPAGRSAGQRDFAFVGLDEAQLGADPERGHVFTDRLLRARGHAETMILGSESLTPMVRGLLLDAEIVTRPRFSTLSYAGAKKLSRLPPRSAIVAFSVEEVYAVAEMLRRFAGGAAVVMGALSPRTRNAQVAMFQSGEVDYLVATDAVGMGLNLDVAHVAFASLTKFDGRRRWRLTIAEMAQIAGRAGRHQRDGTFGTLAGEGAEFDADEIEAIEEHRFAPLTQLFWRNATPRVDSIATLTADLTQKPADPLLRPAPEAIDLAVLKRLAADPAVIASARGPARVARLWAAASLPDFRQLGPEHHSRFVARLWTWLGQGPGRIPQAHAAQEVAKLDNVQGDVDTLAARIAAARTWSYIAHRPDWLPDPPAMAARTEALEERLSDALHERLKARFVDRRTSVLLKKIGADSALLPVAVAADGSVAVDGETIGRLDGFRFTVAPGARAGESKLLLAAAERHLGGIMADKARELAGAEDAEFRLGTGAGGRPAIFWRDAELGVLEKGKTLVTPLLKPARAVAALEGAALRAVVERAEAWLEAQIARHLGGVVALFAAAQDPAVPGGVRAMAIQLAEAGGVAGRPYLESAIAALDKDARSAARKIGIVFGALDVWHHAVLKPGAVRWRSALFAVREGRALPELPPESAVHLTDWRFAGGADARNAGYRRVGREYLRIDLAERLVKAAHEARQAGGGGEKQGRPDGKRPGGRGQGAEFRLDPALATSLGLGAEAHEALLRDAGFRKRSARVPVALPAAADAGKPDSGDGLVAGETPGEETGVTETVPAPELPAEAPAPAEPPLEQPGTAPQATSPAEHAEAGAPAVADTGVAAEPATERIDLWRFTGMKRAGADRSATQTSPAPTGSLGAQLQKLVSR